MVRRPRVWLVAACASILLPACGSPEPPETAVRTETHGARVVALSAAPVVATGPLDPCWDHDRLEAGTGDPERQDWYNHLDARGFARAHMACAPYLWGTAEWECLDQLWREESGWNHFAQGYGATYGIPQSYPGSKMANPPGGPDWRTNPRTQVRWGLQYLKDRYGSPLNTPHRCRAGY